jgi:methylmalonyl-CoA/ethylmalonyl-CoA epimerase
VNSDEGDTLAQDLFGAQLGEPHHHAYVVDDIASIVNRLVDQLGAGPFFLIENVPVENVVSRGEAAEFVHNSAFGSWNGNAIELIEVVSLAPERVERGFSGARPRLQHVGYVVPAAAVAEVRSSFDERGLTQYLSSQLGGVETTLHDASTTLGHDIEILVDNQGLHDFFSMVIGAAEGWDGSEPLRSVAS